MKITGIQSYVLQYPLEDELGYSQQYYDRRTAHIVEVTTDQGISGYGEAFGGGGVAFGNKAIVEKTIQPMVLGMDPLGFPEFRGQYTVPIIDKYTVPGTQPHLE